MYERPIFPTTHISWLFPSTMMRSFRRRVATRKPIDCLHDKSPSSRETGGLKLRLSTDDAIFLPLLAKQDSVAGQCQQQAARNNAPLSAAIAWFGVQRSRGRLAAALDASQGADDVLRRLASLSGYFPASSLGGREPGAMLVSRISSRRGRCRRVTDAGAFWERTVAVMTW